MIQVIEKLPKTLPPVMEFPVAVTGVYRNPHFGRYEFWFVHPRNKRKALIGECLSSSSQSTFAQWQRTAWHGLLTMVEKKVRQDRTVRACLEQMLKEALADKSSVPNN